MIVHGRDTYNVGDDYKVIPVQLLLRRLLQYFTLEAFDAEMCIYTLYIYM